MIRNELALIGCSLLFGCSSNSAPLRSPSLDYQPPAPVTAADNEPVGADRQAPADKLGQGVTTSGPAPGWSADQTGPKYDPKKQVGGAVEPPAPEAPPRKK